MNLEGSTFRSPNWWHWFVPSSFSDLIRLSVSTDMRSKFSAISAHCLATSLCAALLTYQRFLSPLKRWRCPHACANGGLSCSSHAIKQLQTKGLLVALERIRERLLQCAIACRELRNIPASARQRRPRVLIPCVPFI